MSTPAQWLWMQKAFGIGTHHAHEVFENCGGPDELFSLSSDRLERDRTLTREEKRLVSEADFSLCEHEIAEVEELGFRPVTPDDAEYPEKLRSIHSPPFILYAKGDLDLMNDPYPIAAVGMREPDEYGIRAARKICTEIAALGGVVVSGLARGIDTVCHESALALGGKTIAVLAVGPDGTYPTCSRDLRKIIEAHGLVITEFPLNSQVRGHSFHVRNRIISGLALATVVVQAAEKSGALLTAGHALSQDRDVYAVCGDLFSLKMEGCHELIRSGASPVFSGVELLRGYEAVYGFELEPVCTAERMAALANPACDGTPEPPAPKKRRAAAKRKPAAPKPEKEPERLSTDTLNAEQKAVYLACTENITFDELCEKSGLAAGALLSVLTQLEIFGFVESVPGRRFSPVMK